MKSKIKILTEEYGYEDPIDLAEEYFSESSCPAICKYPDCDAIYEYEHDSHNGYCEECNRNGVQSIYVLLGML